MKNHKKVSKRQKFYKMKGCSKNRKTRKNRKARKTRKN